MKCITSFSTEIRTKINMINHLKENKDRFIDKLVAEEKLTPEQGKEVKNFFKEYSQYESSFDWNKINTFTYETFKDFMDKVKLSTNAVKKGKIEALDIGKDYLILGEYTYKGEKVVIYQPFTWKASRILASNKVGPNVTGKWCISYQKESSGWKGYVINLKKVFAFVEGESIPTKKLAFEIGTEERSLTIWTAFDVSYEATFHDDENKVTFKGKEASMADILSKTFSYKFINTIINKASSNKEDVFKASEEENEEITRKNALKLRNLLTLNTTTNKYSGKVTWKNIKDLPNSSYEEVKIDSLEITGVKPDEYFDYAELSLRDIKPSTLICQGIMLINDGVDPGSFLPETFEGSVAYKRYEGKDLSGCPKTVKNVKCIDCTVLTSLKGIPSKLEKLYIRNCPKLKTFGTAVTADIFDCDSNELSDLYDSQYLDSEGPGDDFFNDEDFDKFMKNLLKDEKIGS